MKILFLLLLFSITNYSVEGAKLYEDTPNEVYPAKKPTFSPKYFLLKQYLKMLKRKNERIEMKLYQAKLQNNTLKVKKLEKKLKIIQVSLLLVAIGLSLVGLGLMLLELSGDFLPILLLAVFVAGAGSYIFVAGLISIIIKLFVLLLKRN